MSVKKQKKNSTAICHIHPAVAELYGPNYRRQREVAVAETGPPPAVTVTSAVVQHFDIRTVWGRGGVDVSLHGL